jgi:hypothetical protein
MNLTMPAVEIINATPLSVGIHKSHAATISIITILIVGIMAGYLFRILKEQEK